MSFPASSMPVDNDLVVYLSGLGLYTTAFSGLVVGFVSKAIDEFQLLTGRNPFLAEAAVSSSYYDPPGAVSHTNTYPFRGGGKLLELDSGFVSISSVSVGYSIDNPGNSLDLNRNLRFLPLNYAKKSLPIDRIEFTFQAWGALGSIQVAGRRGYSDTVPADVWLGIIQRAAFYFLPLVAMQLTGGASQMAEADSHLSFPTGSSKYSGPFGPQLEMWDSNFLRVVNTYRIVRLGV